MLNLFALGIIGISVCLATITLVREELEALRAKAIRKSGGKAISLDPCSSSPTTLDGFDPKIEALLVQLPPTEARTVGASDFVTRPLADGKGQELLLNDRVLLRLPGIAASQRIELYIEPGTA